MENSSRSCEICKKTFNEDQMLETSSRNCYCRKCFKDKIYKASGDTKALRFVQLGKKLIPYPEIYQVKGPTPPSLPQNCSTVSLSKRPIQCPKADCNRYMSVFTLESHFKSEHKNVPIVITQLDARNGSEFHTKNVRYGVAQPLILINVLGHDFSDILPKTSCYCSRTNLQCFDPKPIMVLMATRCHLVVNKDANDDAASPREEANDVDPNVLPPTDRIVIWVASNIQTNLSYTVAVSTKSNKIRQKYFGPVTTLDAKGEDLCKSGACLILTHFHVNRMSCDGTKGLMLDVVMHGPD